MAEHAVLVYVANTSDEVFGLDLLEDPIVEALEASGAGEFDGAETGDEGAVLLAYGRDADELFRVISQALAAAPVPPGSYAVKRYGGAGARETRVELPSLRESVGGRCPPVRSRINYREGDWFAVPLRDGGYAVGVVARMDGRGGVVGYFFPPRFHAVPPLAKVADLDPGQSLRTLRFGDLGLVENKWPIIGRANAWERDRWPLPVFGRLEELTGLARLVKYAEDDLTEPVSETPVSREEVAHVPRDALSGAGAVELILTDLLPQ